MRYKFQAKMPEVEDKISFYMGDVRDLASVKNVMHGVDYIFVQQPLMRVSKMWSAFPQTRQLIR